MLCLSIGYLYILYPKVLNGTSRGKGRDLHRSRPAHSHITQKADRQHKSSSQRNPSRRMGNLHRRQRRAAIVHDLGRQMLGSPGRALRRREAIAQSRARLGCGMRIVGCWFQGNIDAFKKPARSDAEKAVENLNQVVAGLAGLQAAEGVGENQGVGKLTSTNDETSAINGPIIFQGHRHFTLWGRAAVVS